MRAIWVPHSDLPSNQVVEVDDEPDATVTELIEVLDVVEAWRAA
jgi:putative hydrolase of the HAD superfamily